MAKENSFEGKVAWRSPSNLAIIKYWGKYGRQLPRNASISLTLSAAFTDMKMAYQIDDDRTELEIDFTFEGQAKPQFERKIKTFLQSIQDELPFLAKSYFKIDSSNSFPHSSGIASSASSMSALALCLCSIERAHFNPDMSETTFFNRASHFARLGSGSASRSVYPFMAAWGEHPEIEDASNQYAVLYDKIAPVFKTFHDDILIVSAREKSVSSTAGHQLMEGNPYATARYAQANNRMSDLLVALEKGDVLAFGKIAEDEAMTLHGMMMCSEPSYMLVEANTIEMIRRIQSYRNETGVPVFFSLDAGPNIHLLYPDEVAPMVDLFIKDQLKELCIDGRIIQDQVGSGPERLDV